MRLCEHPRSDAILTLAPAGAPRLGDVVAIGQAVVDRDAIVSFAALYDPQPFHLGEAGGAKSFFGGLVASGMQTLAMMQGLTVRSGLLGRLGAIAGLGLDKVRMIRPVQPGDVLHGQVELLDARPSRSRPGCTVLRCRVTGHNGCGDAVIGYELVVLAGAEGPAA